MAPKYIVTYADMKNYLHLKYPDAILISTKIVDDNSIITSYTDVDPDIIAPTITPDKAEALETQKIYKNK